jgi:hypothetical protein
MVGFILGTPGGELLADDHVEATPPLLSMWPWKLKLNEEKSTHARLAPQIGFDPAFLQSLLHNANPFPPPLFQHLIVYGCSFC